MLVPMAIQDLLSEEVAFYLFLGCFSIGLIFSLALGVLGGLFDFGGADVDVDANVEITGDGVTLSPLSPIVICVFLTVFGGVGIIGQELDYSVIASAAMGLVTGVVVSMGFAAGMSWMMTKATASMNLNPETIVGKQAEVSVTIPSGGLGEITYVNNSMRQRASARAEGGDSIKQSSIVEVVKYSGNFYIVRPAE